MSFPLHACWSQFDGYTTFLFQIHTVKYLFFIRFSDSSSHFEHTVGKCTFPVIDMCDNTKVTYITHYFLLIKVYFIMFESSYFTEIYKSIMCLYSFYISYCGWGLNNYIVGVLPCYIGLLWRLFKRFGKR